MVVIKKILDPFIGSLSIKYLECDIAPGYYELLYFALFLCDSNLVTTQSSANPRIG